MTTPKTEDTKTRNFLDIARSFDNAMLVTHAPGGELRARPMSIAKLEDNGDLWFITRMEAHVVEELAHDPRATVLMQQGNKYLRVKGQGQITQDRKKVEELWSESLRVWFDGKSDPSLVLIKVDTTEAEYWNTSGTEGISFVLRAAKAIITGEKMQGTDDIDIHAKVRL